MSEPPPLPHAPEPPQPVGQDVGMRMLLPVGRSGWAIAAGYFGLFSIALIGAPFAIITGIIAIIHIKKSQKTDLPKHGMGRAIFGIAAGVIFPVIYILVFGLAF